MGIVHYSHSSLTYIGILFFWYDGQTGLPIGDRYWSFDRSLWRPGRSRASCAARFLRFSEHGSEFTREFLVDLNSLTSCHIHNPKDFSWYLYGLFLVYRRARNILMQVEIPQMLVGAVTKAKKVFSIQLTVY